MSYNKPRMAGITQPARAGVWRGLVSMAQQQMTHVDRPAWRRFWLALLGLGMAFFLALYSTALHEQGRAELAAWTAALSLVVAGVVAWKVVPYLAQRTALERWMTKVEYEFTREGAAYFLIVVTIAIAALNTGNNLLFIILANLLAGILLSGILSAIVLSKLELDFALPEHVFAEQPLISRLAVENLKWLFPSFSLTVSARKLPKRKRKRASWDAPRQIWILPSTCPISRTGLP